MPICPNLNDWFAVKIEVKGQDVKIHINDQLAFSQSDFIQIPTGKIGFRNCGVEQALVKEVKVS